MIFSNLKEKQQKAYRIKSYDELLINTIASMFTYKGMPDTVDIGFMEAMTMLRGLSAIWKHPAYGWIASEAGVSGEPNVYGIGKDIICSAWDGTVHTFSDWQNNKDVIVLWNNSIKMPDMNIGRYSDMLAELETSINLNILFSRMYPIPVAKDQPTMKAINDSIRNMLDGKLKDGCTILSDNAVSRILDSGASIDTIKLTDESKSQYIQYLSHFRDDLFRWFYSLYGMNSQGSSKMAQQTVDEVNQDNNASMIIPHDMLRCRQRFIDELKSKQPEVFSEADVSFSECWQSRLANMDDEFKKTDEELEESEADEELKETVEEVSEDED